MTALAPGEVVGREAGLERISGFLDPGRGELALLLEGVAGIGKTTLWRAGIELGREQHYRVLWCQPTASETAFSFAALGDLLSPVIEDLLPRLPPPQRAAIGAALALVEGDVANVDERVVGLALVSSLRLLAVRDPVLVAVDDVQWLDPASAACCGSRPEGSRTSASSCFSRSGSNLVPLRSNSSATWPIVCCGSMSAPCPAATCIGSSWLVSAGRCRARRLYRGNGTQHPEIFLEGD